MIWAIMFVILYVLHSSGKGNREKSSSDQAQTQDLRSITEFQPHELPIPVEIVPNRPYVPVTGVSLSSIPLRPSPKGW